MHFRINNFNIYIMSTTKIGIDLNLFKNRIIQTLQLKNDSEGIIESTRRIKAWIDD